MCYLPHTFGNAYALYAMKRDGLARVSKIDVDALLDKNKLLAEGCDRFSHVRRRRQSRGDLRDYSKSEWHKFLYLDDPKVKVKSLGNHARRQPRATNSGTDRRACIE